MKNFELKLAIMLEENSVIATEELIYEMLESLGNLVEDTDHYPTLPDNVEELATLLDLDVDEASEEVINILELIVISHRNYTYEQLAWQDLIEKEVM